MSLFSRRCTNTSDFYPQPSTLFEKLSRSFIPSMLMHSTSSIVPTRFFSPVFLFITLTCVFRVQSVLSRPCMQRVIQPRRERDEYLHEDKFDREREKKRICTVSLRSTSKFQRRIIQARTTLKAVRILNRYRVTS